MLTDKSYWKDLKAKMSGLKHRYESEVNARLARLLAEEDVTVVYRNVRTAMFDTKTRVLTLPNWMDIKPSTRAALTAHEVGHARWTPNDLWISFIKKYPKRKATLNIVEDCRVDRKIIHIYPGLAKDYAKSYRELHKRDFYGLSKIKDLNGMYLHDRINLHYNTDPRDVTIPFFNAEEESLRDRCGKTVTFDDVMILTMEIFDYMKKNQVEEDNASAMPPPPSPSSEDGEEDGEMVPASPDFNEDGDDDNSGEPDDMGDVPNSPADDNDESDDGAEPEDGSGSANSEPTVNEDDDDDTDSGNDGSDSDDDSGDDSGESDSDSDGSGSGSEDESDDDSDVDDGNNSGTGDDENDPDADPEDSDSDNSGESGSAGSGNKSDESENESDDSEVNPDDHDDDIIDNDGDSETNNAFEENLGDKADTTGSERIYATMPDFDNSPYVKPKVFVENNLKFYKKMPVSSQVNIDDIYDAWAKTSKPIAMLVKRNFEMKRASLDYAEESFFETGNLDMGRIGYYKVSEHIFADEVIREIDTTKHRMIFLLDCSSSMSGEGFTGSSIELMILTMFCDSMRIPYDVYGFFDGTCSASHSIYGAKVAASEGDIWTGRLHMVNMVSSDMTPKERKIAFKGLAMIKDMSYPNAPYELNTTPLDEALMATSGLLDTLYTDEKVSLFILTDGGTNGNVYIKTSGGAVVDISGERYQTENVTIIDNKTKIHYDMGDSKYTSHRSALTKIMLENLHGKVHSLNWYYIISKSRDVDIAMGSVGVKIPTDKDWRHKFNNEWFAPFKITDNVDCTIMVISDISIESSKSTYKDMAEIEAEFMNNARAKKAFRIMAETLTDAIT